MRSTHPIRPPSSSPPKPPRQPGADSNAVDLADCVRSRCCRRSCACAVLALLLNALAPTLVAHLAWSVLPDFRWEPLQGLVYLATWDAELGVRIQVGSDWAFVCAKAHCPSESFACLFDGGCRRLVRELTVTESCSRERTRARVCGARCSRAASALLGCLDGGGAPCVYERKGEPVVVREAALSEAELTRLEALAAAQEARHGAVHRAFGALDGTNGHDVTWLTPLIYSELPSLLARLKVNTAKPLTPPSLCSLPLLVASAHCLWSAPQAIAVDASVEAMWDVHQPASLQLRCAERLQYAGNGSEGLGWHWDVGSTVTTVIMLHAANATDGQLQVASECEGAEEGEEEGGQGSAVPGSRCCERSVRLERGDVAVYSSRHRHRVTAVRSPRAVVVLEWWRGEATMEATRPLGESHRLQEPQTKSLMQAGWPQFWRGVRTGAAAGTAAQAEEVVAAPSPELPLTSELPLGMPVEL